MASSSNLPLIATGIAMGASALFLFSTTIVRAAGFRTEHETWIERQKVYLSEEDEEVMKNPLSSIYPHLALPLDMFGSTEKTSQDQLIPVESLTLSTDTFERCLDALASETKWPVNYIRTERRRRECDRLALYLLGVVDTFMSDGPKRINLTPTTYLSISVLYFCAANLGIQEAYTEKITNPRRDYHHRNHSLAANRVVDHSSKHAVSNSFITFYELIILYLLQFEEYDSAMMLLKKLQPSNHIRLFKGFVYLAIGEYDDFRSTMKEIIALITPEHPTFELLSEYASWDIESYDYDVDEMLRHFELPHLCTYFAEPFSGSVQD